MIDLFPEIYIINDLFPEVYVINDPFIEVVCNFCIKAYYTPAPRRGRGVYCFTSVRLSFRPSNIFFVAFFSVTADGRNLRFGDKHHIGIPYCG